MANEASFRYAESMNGTAIHDYTCADATGIEKGALLYLSGDHTVSFANTTGLVFAGIAAREKIASDGRTQIAVAKDGYWDITASGAIALGAYVKTAAPGNYVMSASASDIASSYAIIVGVAEEAASNGEVIIVHIGGDA